MMDRWSERNDPMHYTNEEFEIAQMRYHRSLPLWERRLADEERHLEPFNLAKKRDFEARAQTIMPNMVLTPFTPKEPYGARANIPLIPKGLDESKLLLPSSNKQSHFSPFYNNTFFER